MFQNDSNDSILHAILMHFKLINDDETSEYHKEPEE